MNMAISVFLADLANSSHQSAIIDLLDMYCRDEFGDCKPLSAQARENMIPGLIKHGGARVFLACDDEQPLGVAICMIGFSSATVIALSASGSGAVNSAAGTGGDSGCFWAAGV